MEKIVKFEKAEVVGATKQEAYESAPFFIQGDATASFKKWSKKQSGAITDAMKEDFYLTYLKNKTHLAPGTGFAITLQSAVKDSRKRPYTVHDKKNEKGRRKYKVTYVIKDTITGKVVGKSQETKAKAKELAKELVVDLKHKVICTYSKQVIEGEPVAFEVDYTPANNTRQGKYIVFGVKA